MKLVNGYCHLSYKEPVLERFLGQICYAEIRYIQRLPLTFRLLEGSSWSALETLPRSIGFVSTRPPLLIRGVARGIFVQLKCLFHFFEINSPPPLPNALYGNRLSLYHSLLHGIAFARAHNPFILSHIYFSSKIIFSFLSHEILPLAHSLETHH